MTPPCAAVIVAGGSGSRMKADGPKQFLSLGGRPLLAHALEAFQACSDVDLVVLVLPADDFEAHRQRMETFCREKPHRLVPGGATRQDSVKEGMKAVEASEVTGPGTLVAVHDGARPLVAPGLVSEVITAAGREAAGGSILGIPVVETLKMVDSNLAVRSTVDRDRYYRAQTPQVFRLELLKRAFERAELEGFQGTDEAALVERLGAPIRVVLGSERNLKVTTAEDLELAEYYLRSHDDGTKAD